MKIFGVGVGWNIDFEIPLCNTVRYQCISYVNSATATSLVVIPCIYYTTVFMGFPCAHIPNPTRTGNRQLGSEPQPYGLT